MIQDFVAQWRKMKSALERQQERLNEGPVDGRHPKAEEYHVLIGRVIDQLDQLTATGERGEREKLSAGHVRLRPDL